MDFESPGLLLGLLVALPVAFLLGWAASRIDLRQWQRADRQAPKAYFKGLNLLLNEQTDKAVDAFIEAVQHDPDTSELHFALGNLFRRRGEFERAVRVHQHLLQRADLSAADRERAQHALAQDYMKAGLFDRAEDAFRALAGTPFETEARLALLSLAERSRDWRTAAEVAAQLEKSGTGSFATRISHYLCELALEADEQGDAAAFSALLGKAQAASPQAARPLVLQAQSLARQGQPAEAIGVWSKLRLRDPAAFARLSGEYAACALACGQGGAARELLTALFDQHPSIDLLRAIATVDGVRPGESPQLLDLLREQPNLSVVIELLNTPTATWPPSALEFAHDAVARAAKPLQRYRCAACGFEAQRHFWQCPGCLGWDTFPSQRIEDL